MEDRKSYAIALSSIIVLASVIVVARLYLKLSKTFFLICGAALAAILAVFACVLIRCRFNKRRRLLETQLISEGRELRIEYSFLRKVAGLPIKFRYKELVEATDGFQSLVGRGASAYVFKGILSDGTAVAVKRIEGEERGEKVFRSEVAAIASVHHVNLVRLLGYCSSAPTGPPRFLVYEFITNGSLDKWIFPSTPRELEVGRRGSARPSGCLSWELRRQVAIDVAKGLSYLHHDCRSRILHLDVKPENILLDDNYRAMLSDFGLSKLMGKEESKVMTTIRGTKGYLAPEWLLEQGISEKSDIYSYGMVLLEIIGGRRNVCLIEHSDRSKRKFQHFPKLVSEKLREGKVMDVVDSRIKEGCGNSTIDETEVRRLVYVALWCIQEKATLRPSMSHVLEMLEGRVPVEEPPDTKMIIVDLLSSGNEEQQTLASPTGLGRPRITAAAAAVVISPQTHEISTSSRCLTMSALSGR